MTSYRGVDKYELAASLREAKKFVDELDIGPVTKKWFDGWVGSFPYREIREAKDDDDLVSVMSRTGARAMFQPFQDVFIYHGMAALADDGVGPQYVDPTQIYADLAAWDTFKNVPQKAPLLDDLKKEIDGYLIAEGLRRLALDEDMRRGLSPDGSDPAEAMLDDYLNKNLRKHKNNRPLADWLDSVFRLGAGLASVGRNHENDSEIKGMLSSAPVNGIFFLKDILGRTTGLNGYRSEVMNVPHFIHLYAVEPRTTSDRSDEGMERLRGQVSQVLRPYSRLDEAYIKSSDYRDSRLQGRPAIFFLSSARAAQQVANLVSDGKVACYDGMGPFPEITPQRRRGDPSPGLP